MTACKMCDGRGVDPAYATAGEKPGDPCHVCGGAGERVAPTPLVYIAASSSAAARPRLMSAVEAVHALGADVYDWWSSYQPTMAMDRAARTKAAHDDIAAIQRASLVWLLAPPCRSDARWEAGYALAYHPTLLVSGPLSDRGIFASLVYEYESDADALVRLAEMLREAAR